MNELANDLFKLAANLGAVTAGVPLPFPEDDPAELQRQDINLRHRLEDAAARLAEGSER